MIELQIISSILLLLQKIFMILKEDIISKSSFLKKLTSILPINAWAWIVGIFGIIALSACLYLQTIIENRSDLWIMVFSNSASAPIMCYALLVVLAKEGSSWKGFLEKWNITFKIIMIILTISVCIMLFIRAFTVDLDVLSVKQRVSLILQLALSATSLLGTLFLAFNKRKSSMTGWGLYAVTHVMSATVMFMVGSPILGVCQIASIPFAYIGIMQQRERS